MVYRDKGYFDVELGASMRPEVLYAGSSAAYLRQPQEQEDQPEAGSGRVYVRCDQAGVQCGACAGADGASGSCEDGFRVFLF